jgi:hypothetical protein
MMNWSTPLTSWNCALLRKLLVLFRSSFSGLRLLLVMWSWLVAPAGWRVA